MPIPTPSSPQTKPQSRPSDAGLASITRPASIRAAGLSVLFYGAWLGLISGWFALGLLLVQSEWSRSVHESFLRLNRHASWMMPLTSGLMLTAAAVPAALYARRSPRKGVPRALAALVFLASLDVLATVEGIHWVATVILASGVSACVARRLGARELVFRIAVWRSLPLVLCFSISVGSLAAYLGRAQDRTPGTPAPAKSPNVLLVVLDTVRADRLSLYGYPRPTSPNLERLAQRGLRFDQARAPASYTMPSHASMFTGHWPHDLNDVQYSPLDRRYPTLAEYLRDRGYRTGGFVGNTYYCNAWFGLARGFSHYEDYPQRRDCTPAEMLRSLALGRLVLAAAGQVGFADTEAYDRRVTAADVNRRALAWLDQRPNNEPFFLFLNYIDAHAPYFPPADYARRHTDIARTIHGYNLLAKTQRKKLSENTPQDDENRRAAAQILGDAYDDCLGYLDEQLGRLLDALDRRGQLDNTLVIMTADHGEHLGEHELFGHGTSLYQPLVHVPLVIVPPKGQGPATSTVVSRPVSLRAIPATVVDALGGRHSPFPGASLVRKANDDVVLSELTLKDHARTTRPGQWHSPAAYGPMQALARDGLAYVRNGNGREELYDLAHDPNDRDDLAGRLEFLPALEQFRRDLADARSAP